MITNIKTCNLLLETFLSGGGGGRSAGFLKFIPVGTFFLQQIQITNTLLIRYNKKKIIIRKEKHILVWNTLFVGDLEYG